MGIVEVGGQASRMKSEARNAHALRGYTPLPEFGFRASFGSPTHQPPLFPSATSVIRHSGFGFPMLFPTSFPCASGVPGLATAPHVE